MSASDEEVPAAAGAGAAANSVPGEEADEQKPRKGRQSRRKPFCVEHMQERMQDEFENVFGRSSADFRNNAHHFYKANAMVRAGPSESVP